MNTATTPQQQLWTKDFLLIFTANLMVFVSFYCLLPTLPLFVTDYLGSDVSAVGYIFGFFALAAVIARPLAGFAVDTLGRKRVLFITLFLLAISIAIYNFVTTLLLLFIIRMIHGLCWGFATTAAGTVATDLVPAERRGEGIGYYGLSNTFAMAAGPALGLLILNHAGFMVLFSSSSLLAAAALICVLAITFKETHAARKPVEMRIDTLFENRVLIYAVITFFIALLYSSIISFVILLGKEIGITNPGSYFLAYASTLILSRPYAGKALDASGPKTIMAIGFAALALSFVLLFCAADNLVFILSGLFLGIGFGIVQPTTLALAINRVEPFRRGAANGTIFTAFDLGVGLGSILLGILSEHAGLSYMYLTCAFLVIIPLFLFYGMTSHSSPCTEHI
ncbi:MFS transporter [Anaerospora sp.]|uniref:MFS transporter n=1 Tax=Anaerospora sp. TaxID=1960278 RepID=UPI00289F6B13|nr:MFS transporter [Anaerospora sp.]